MICGISHCISSILLVLSFSHLSGQGLEKVFIHAKCELEGKGICPLPDGGALVTGRSDDCYSPTDTAELPLLSERLFTTDLQNSAFLARISPEGKLSWIQSIQGVEGQKIAACQDGNFVVTGFVPGYRERLYEGDRTQGIWIGKYSAEGQELWWQILKCDYNSTPEAIIITKGGDILVLGDREYPGTGLVKRQSARLVRLSPTGTLIWEREVGGFGSFYGYDLKQCKDGGFIVAGAEPAGSISRHKMAIFKLDSLGKHQWYQPYTWKKSEYSNEDNWAYSITESQSGGYLVGGVAHYNPKEYRILRIDEMGKEIWSEVYPGEIFTPPHITETQDGEILLGGVAALHPQNLTWKPEKYDESDYEESIYLVKTDAKGKVIWERIFGYDQHPELFDLKLDEKGNIFLVGKYRETKKSYLYGEEYVLDNRAKGIYYLKLNKDGK